MGCISSSRIPYAGIEAFVASYSKGEHLGDGGYSTVYEVVHRDSGSRFAAKEIQMSFLKAKEKQGIFHEIRLLKLLNHPHIVRLVDVFRGDEKIIIVMELIQGGQLFERIVSKVTYGEREARSLAKSLFEAIAHCHMLDIVHRDLKPENILLAEKLDDTKIKVVDFGFARIVKGDSLRSQRGSEGYIAPEIILNKPYGKAIDVWSLGVVVFEMLAGRSPFRAANRKQTFKNIVSGNFTFEPKYWSIISDEAKDLLQRMLTVDPIQRITINDAIRHPWMSLSDEKIPKINLTAAQSEMKRHMATIKFRAAAKVVIAVNKLKASLSAEKLELESFRKSFASSSSGSLMPMITSLSEPDLKKSWSSSLFIPEAPIETFKIQHVPEAVREFMSTIFGVLRNTFSSVIIHLDFCSLGIESFLAIINSIEVKSKAIRIKDSIASSTTDMCSTLLRFDDGGGLNSTVFEVLQIDQYFSLRIRGILLGLHLSFDDFALCLALIENSCNLRLTMIDSCNCSNDTTQVCYIVHYLHLAKFQFIHTYVPHPDDDTLENQIREAISTSSQNIVIRTIILPLDLLHCWLSNLSQAVKLVHFFEPSTSKGLNFSGFGDCIFTSISCQFLVSVSSSNETSNLVQQLQTIGVLHILEIIQHHQSGHILDLKTIKQFFLKILCGEFLSAAAGTMISSDPNYSTSIYLLPKDIDHSVQIFSPVIDPFDSGEPQLTAREPPEFRVPRILLGTRSVNNLYVDLQERRWLIAHILNLLRQPRHVVVLKGETGIGKSSVAINCIDHLAKSDIFDIIFELHLKRTNFVPKNSEDWIGLLSLPSPDTTVENIVNLGRRILIFIDCPISIEPGDEYYTSMMSFIQQYLEQERTVNFLCCFRVDRFDLSNYSFDVVQIPSLTDLEVSKLVLTFLPHLSVQEILMSPIASRMTVESNLTMIHPLSAEDDSLSDSSGFRLLQFLVEQFSRTQFIVSLKGNPRNVFYAIHRFLNLSD